MLYEPPWLLLPYIGIGNVVNSQYRYIQDLHKLEATATGMGPIIFKPATPLHLPAWYEALADHPDKQFSSYILNGITLSHAATVVIPGCTFLRRMIDTMKIPKCQHHHVRLNSEFRSDIQWWACFLPIWNGRSIFPPQQASHSFW